VCAHGLVVEFTTIHYYIIGISGIILWLIHCGKIVREITYLPINLIKKVLFRL
jgi:uncharacterized membrane protein YuzA (DUF378 family)